MSHTFLSLFIVITNLLLLIFGLELYNSPNVKTALFQELDITKTCWNHDQIILLHARMIMQDLIPKEIPRDIPHLVEYLRSTEKAVVLHSSEGKVRSLMMLALSDVLGGYVQAIALPMAKEAYYAGNINYTTMFALYELLNEMKSRLRTNGGRWSRPVDMSKFPVKVTALHLSVDNSELACKALFITPAEKCPPGLSRISIPYLDYDAKPGAVALPLKSRNLYSLKTAASSHIIARFYILVRQCLSEMPPSDIELFDRHFFRWLTINVVPHLYEDIWYPGFGSVMRIVETINGTQSFHRTKPFYDANDTSLEETLMKAKSCGFYSSLAKYNFWWLIILLIILLFLILICFCCCWWMCFYYFRHSSNYVKEKSSSGILNAVLSIYCGLKEKKDSKDDSKKVISGQDYYELSGNLYHRLPIHTEPQANYPPIKLSSDELSSVTSTISSTSEYEDSITSSR